MASNPSSTIYTLPLFPLHSVLFPQFPLQLHIFEERYKVMMNACIERDQPFGVVLIKEGEEVGAPATPHDVGCTARILAVKRLADGRMHLLAAGEHRFRLLDYVEAELPYLIGRVEPLEDLPAAAPAMPKLLEEVSDLFLRYLRLLAECANQPLPDGIELPDDAALLAFCIASVAQLSLADKQRLLEMVDTQERLEQERALLTAQIEALETMQARNEWPSNNPVTAAPLDINGEFWQEYRKQTRN